MSAEQWQWVAEKLGIPVAFCVVLCYAIYATGTWTASHVFEPLVQKHIQFLETEQQVMKSVATDVGSQTQLLRDIRNDQRKFPAVAEKMP